jgi:hypothetical protein
MPPSARSEALHCLKRARCSAATSRIRSTVAARSHLQINCRYQLRRCGTPGNVALYITGQGAPVLYSDPKIYYYWFCGYDEKSNLFVDGISQSGTALLAELPKGSSTLTNIAPNQKKKRPPAACNGRPKPALCPSARLRDRGVLRQRLRPSDRTRQRPEPELLTAFCSISYRGRRTM